MFWSKKVIIMLRFLAIPMLLMGVVPIYSMEFVDSTGNCCKLPKKEYQVFLVSDLGQQLVEDIWRGNEVDFSCVKRAGLKGQNILRALANAHSPEMLALTSEIMPEEAQLLETAHYLGLQQEKCAQYLAYRLWPVIQKNGPNPLNLSEWEKGYARAMARPHMPCPAMMLEYLKSNENSRSVSNSIYQLFDSSSGILNLSHVLCFCAGFTDKFGTLEGLGHLVRYVCENRLKIYMATDLQDIILDGHMLDTFSLKEIQDMTYGLRRLSMRNNYLSELSRYQIDTHALPTGELDLSGNLISSVSDDVFQAINRHRAQHRIQYEFTLCLEHNRLTEKQKKELQKKFYNATHMIPERLTIAGTMVPHKYLLAVAPLIALIKDSNYFEEPNMMRAAVMLAVFFWWWYLFTNRFDVHLAQLAHPTIEDTRNGDFDDRLRVIWPKNSAKLTL